MSPTIVTQQANTYPTARTLFNIYNANTVRALDRWLPELDLRR